MTKLNNPNTKRYQVAECLVANWDAVEDWEHAERLIEEYFDEIWKFSRSPESIAQAIILAAFPEEDEELDQEDDEDED